jgi:cell division protein FtsA
MITGMGEAPSAGVRKGEIIDLENAVVCVRSALAMAEESGKVAIRQVHLAVSGGHLESVINRGTVPVVDPEAGIAREDVEQVMEVARAIHLAPEREVLHTICQHFCIDGQERVIKPEGMEGARLALDMLVVHGVRARLHNTVRVVRSVPMDVQDVAFSGLCAALAVLTPEQKKSGVVVIDLGGGTTNYLAYADGVVATAGALGVGGDHITNDIALAFTIPGSQAESLKRGSGAATLRSLSGAPRVTLPPEVGFPGRSVSVKALQTVIHARVEEMFGMVVRRLDREGILHHVGAGIVLTGGGAHLRGVTEVAEQVFALPCALGRPINVSGLAAVAAGPEYATGSGLVLYGFRTSADQRRESRLGGWLKDLFRRRPAEARGPGPAVRPGQAGAAEAEGAVS